MSAQNNLFDFTTASLPHITVVSTDLYCEKELSFTENTIENRPIQCAEVVMMSFLMEGMIEANYEGIKAPILSTKNRSTLIYAPLTNRFRLPAHQHFDSFIIAIQKDFFNDLAADGDDWAAGIIKQVEYQQPFSGSTQSLPVTLPMRHLIQQIRNYKPTNSLHRLYLQSRINDLLYNYFTQLQNFNTSKPHMGFSQPDIDKLFELKIYLENNFLENHSLESLSRYCGLNLFKLKTGFKEVHGTTVFDYLRQLRMEYASALLRDTQLNVGEVALQLGYSHLNHFSAAFKKHFGESPSQWNK